MCRKGALNHCADCFFMRLAPFRLTSVISVTTAQPYLPGLEVLRWPGLLKVKLSSGLLFYQQPGVRSGHLTALGEFLGLKALLLRGALQRSPGLPSSVGNLGFIWITAT